MCHLFVTSELPVHYISCMLLVCYCMLSLCYQCITCALHYVYIISMLLCYLPLYNLCMTCITFSSLIILSNQVFLSSICTYWFRFFVYVFLCLFMYLFIICNTLYIHSTQLIVFLSYAILYAFKVHNTSYPLFIVQKGSRNFTACAKP